MKKGVVLFIFSFILFVGVSYAVPDSDGDRIPDVDEYGNVVDQCPDSQTTVVDQFGCSCAQKTASDCDGVWCCEDDGNECTNDCSLLSGYMITVVFSDIHGRPLEDLVQQVITPLNPDLIYCLGDFDEPHSVREARALVQRYNGGIVPGNHDYALYHGGSPVSIGTIPNNLPPNEIFAYVTRKFAEVRERFRSDSEAFEFIGKLLETNPSMTIEGKLDESQYDDRYRMMVLHGVLGGHLTSQVYSTDPFAKLWYRLQNERDTQVEEPLHRKNFEQMKALNLNLMIRGHDKRPQIASMGPQGEITIATGVGDHILSPHNLQTVTVGPYQEGYYAVIDTNHPEPRVSLRQL